jgi:hypothetical protein
MEYWFFHQVFLFGFYWVFLILFPLTGCIRFDGQALLALLLWGFYFHLLLCVKHLQPENLFLPIYGLAG